MKEIEQCRSEAKKLQSWHQPFTMLKAQMTHKASKDENYNAFKTEIHDLIKEQDDFLSEIYVWMQECESLDKAEVTAFFLLKKTYIYIYVALRLPTTPKKITRPVMMSLMRSWDMQQP